MITFCRSGQNILTQLSLFLFLIPGTISGQYQKGRIFSETTREGIGFVNVIITGTTVGTVADKDGNFRLKFEDMFDNDSLRFSIIGYNSKTLLVRQFKEDSIKNIFLTPRVYNLLEVKVTYHKGRKPKEIILGTQVFSDELRSGFENNDLGSEMGIKIHVNGPVRLKNINLNVATCTYDSVTYRLNIYKIKNQTQYENILTKPIYISFTKDKIAHVITYDLMNYSLIVEGDIMVALELYKDLGDGSLLIRTDFFNGTTYHRRTIEDKWTEASGAIGMYLHGQLNSK